MSEKKVQVQINGITYNLVTDESEDHIKEIASYVEKKLKEAKTDNLGYDRELVLTSLNIANDLYRVGNKYNRLKEDSAEAVEKYPSLIENYKKSVDHNDQLIAKADELNQANQALEDENKELSKQLKANEDNDRLIEKLRNEIKRLQKEAASLKSENEHLKGKL